MPGANESAGIYPYLFSLTLASSLPYRIPNSREPNRAIRVDLNARLICVSHEIVLAWMLFMPIMIGKKNLVEQTWRIVCSCNTVFLACLANQTEINSQDQIQVGNQSGDFPALELSFRQHYGDLTSQRLEDVAAKGVGFSENRLRLWIVHLIMQYCEHNLH